MAIEDFYKDTATVTRRTQTQDITRGWVDTETTFTILCRVNFLSGTEVIISDKQTSVVVAKIYCSTDVGLKKSDLIEVGGQSLEVHAVRNIDNWNKFYTIECTRRT